MRSKTIMVLLALVFGGLAIFAGQKYIERQSGRARHLVQVVERPAPTQTIVVAAVPLKFGMELSRAHLREIAGPKAPSPAAPL